MSPGIWCNSHPELRGTSPESRRATRATPAGRAGHAPRATRPETGSFASSPAERTSPTAPALLQKRFRFQLPLTTAQGFLDVHQEPGGHADLEGIFPQDWVVSVLSFRRWEPRGILQGRSKPSLPGACCPHGGGCTGGVPHRRHIGKLVPHCTTTTLCPTGPAQ